MMEISWVTVPVSEFPKNATFAVDAVKVQIANLVLETIKRINVDSYTYRVKGVVNPSGIQGATAVEVYVGQELVGEIDCPWTYGKYHITLNSRNTTRKKNGRNIPARTIDPSKAAAMVRKHFTPKDLKERGIDMLRDLDGGIRAGNMKVVEFDRKYSVVAAQIREYVCSHPEEFRSIIKAMNKPTDTLDGLQELKDEVDIITHVRRSRDLSVGFLVLQINGEYYINGSDIPTPFADIPDSLKERIGMLRLVHDKTFVRNVGYKHAGDCLYIVP
jgi:hypothetical protein